ncbi:flagellar basal body-associated protein FliL [Pandoraea pulmonicola]|uniref:Flagellar basal body-associated protein FliL n=2 Tax=Pandoraea pulmonicola TaxID=93221 RepID=A0AAJ5CZU4_PANPU|nr:flagellar basal body-associated protein FliL [Pandoraea pulmonicola]
MRFELAMNKKTRVMVGLVLAIAGAAAGGFWVYARSVAHDDGAAAQESLAADPYKYVGVEKIVVMLKPDNETDVREIHYAALDIILKSAPEKEASVREQLPLLSSIAVKAVSGQTLESIRNMSIDDLSCKINAAFTESYRHRNVEQPFVTAMIGKLLVE